MGNKDSQLGSLLHDNHDLWLTTQTTPLSVRVQHRLNHKEGEQFSLQQIDLRKHSSIYVLRRTFDSLFVTIHDIIRQGRHRACGNSGMVSVIVEHIPYRLSDLGAISFDQSMYILATILEGYAVLVRHGVPFYLIDDINICFNAQGKCKFWINENLYLALPPTNRLVKEHVFLEEVFSCLQERTSQVNPNFFMQKEKMGTLTLQKALKLVQSFRNGTVDHIASVLESQKYSSNIVVGKVSVAKWRSRARNHQNMPSDLYRRRIKDFQERDGTLDKKVSLSQRGLSCKEDLRPRMLFNSPQKHLSSQSSKLNPETSTGGRSSPPF